MTSSVKFFAQLQNQLDSELPFAAYRKPHETLIKALFQNDSLVYEVSDYKESGFVFAPFDTTQNAIIIPALKSKFFQCEFVMTSIIETAHKEINSSQNQKEFHILLVQTAIDAIKSKKFQKIVVSRKETIPLKNDNPINIFKRLLNQYETAFVYCFYHPKVGLWLGATPETLLQLDGNRLITMALAGTQKYNGMLNVEWKSKEKEEQQLVTDFIVNSLQSSVFSLQSSVANVNVSKAETVQAGNLLHLKTSISANFEREKLNLEQLLKAMHPTPAVCGLPKENAKQFILNNENYNREFYTGFLGELNMKVRTSRNSIRHNVENNAYASVKTISNLYVNLRCMQLKDNQAFIYVGGGITKDSIAENEWEETVSKSKVIKHIL